VSRSTILRLGAFAAVMAVIAVVGGSAAFATSGNDATNGSILVTASLISSGANPDVATAGDTVIEAYSVTNLSTTDKDLSRIFVNSDLPAGPHIAVDHLMNLGPGKTQSWSRPVKISSSTPSGVYTLSIASVEAGVIDPSASSATVTINNG
jgi:hypothetical protein